jgi:hypothetical protein
MEIDHVSALFKTGLTAKVVYDNYLLARIYWIWVLGSVVRFTQIEVYGLD